MKATVKFTADINRHTYELRSDKNQVDYVEKDIAAERK